MHQGFRWRAYFSFSLIVSTIVAASLAVSAVPAAAASAKYAAIVIDANTGKVLHSENADSRRYPASLTKMMTLYLTFEALKRGKIRKSTPVRFSAQAAAQPPTKIGVKAGNSITVEQAIYALITRSANDASVALAELLGGSEQRFALMMTQKARALGMRGTVFRNPHGLPDGGQFTTARDMATLGIALREHYPQYYGYFSVRSFKFGRQRIANHNKLLGRVSGVDGIKTGYTRASGFNLVSSVADGNRRLVAVVLGGQSGRARDDRMAKLIATYMPKASGRGGGALIARTDDTPLQSLASTILPKKGAPTPDSRPEEVEDVIEATEAEVAPKPSRKMQALAAADLPEQAYAAESTPAEGDFDPTEAASGESGKWVIQVASSPSAKEAQAALERTRRAATVLADATAYTVPFDKNGAIYHRARFGGFASQVEASKACGALKRKKIACYATQQD